MLLAADHGIGRRLLRTAYAGAARGYAGYVLRGEPQAAAYVSGTLSSGDAVHGLSDIDVVVVVAPDPTGATRARVRQRCTRVARVVPARINPVDDWPMVYDECGLEEIASRTALTYGLDDGAASYCEPNTDIDKIRLLERPCLYGPVSTWRLIAGPDRRPVEPAPDEATRRLTSWLELQNWWRWAFAACVEPDRPHNGYLCVKLIAEVARIWLWLRQGERIGDRVEALARGRVELPTEADAFERASELHRRLRRMPPAPIADFLPAFVRLSSRLAAELARDVASAGDTKVRLKWPADGELALPHGGVPSGKLGVGSGTESPLMPLVDWRALALPAMPDETFALVAGDPGDPAVVAAAATADNRGPVLTLSAEHLLLHPKPMGGRARLRSVQCEVTDPVSFALAHGAAVASFPNVPGFSIQDTARRTVSEHAAWLAAGMPERAGRKLGRLITSTRTGLLLESIVEGEPELPLTVDATLELLAARRPGAASVATAAREAYHDYARARIMPPEGVVTALRAIVLALPAYAARIPEPA
jgi:hypothetical protein